MRQGWMCTCPGCLSKHEAASVRYHPATPRACAARHQLQAGHSFLVASQRAKRGQQGQRQAV